MMALLQSVHNKVQTKCTTSLSDTELHAHLKGLFIPFIIILKQFSTPIFSLETDDDHRVVLKSISDGVDCEHDYINATYIDVRALKIWTWLLKRA